MPYRRGWVALLLFTLALINYIDRVTLSFAADPITREFGLSSVTLGYLFSSFLWTYTLFLLPMGSFVDRFGAKKTASVGIGVWSLATAATGLAWSFPSLLATRLIMGAGEASSNPAGARVIREWIPAGERGTLNAIFNSGSYAGPALCALVAGPIIAVFGWRALFFLAGGIGLVWLFCWLTWFARPEDARWLGEEERQKIIAERGAKKVDLDSAAGKSGLLKLLSSGPTLWGLALTQGCNVYSQYLFLTWMPSYLQNTKGLSIAKTGFYAAIPYAIAVVLCILIGRFSDRLLRGEVGGGKRRYMIATAMVLAAVILFAPWVNSLWLILALIALSLTGVASTTSLNFALLNDLLPNPKDIGIAMAFLVVGGNICGLLAPIVTGYVIASTGSYDMAFVIAGTLLVIGAASILTLTRQPIGGREATASLPAARA
ncbi:MAG: MFS transporter [Rhodospirillales bacterium]|nr:MFS transporter [Acetobacter sp.]